MKVTKTTTGCFKLSAATKISITCKPELQSEITQTGNEGLAVFPNPSSNEFKIDLGDEIYQINIYDALGRMVFSHAASTGILTFGNDWSAGVYFVVASDEKHLLTAKVIKE